MSIQDNLTQIRAAIPAHVTLVAVSKTRTLAEIQEAIDAGQMDFGENKVQELIAKAAKFPAEIRWHLVGHLQRNKVKQVLPFVFLIHSIDSERLLAEIQKEALKINRKVPCLLQVHISGESTKFGFGFEELRNFMDSGEYRKFDQIIYKGLMGMASFTNEQEQVTNEFRKLKTQFEEIRNKSLPGLEEFTEISMGMSSDYEMGIAEGSTIVRIGTDIFGAR
jgi:PLP dependent protein